MEIDWKMLDGLLQFGARLVDCSELMQCSDETIQRRIRDKYDITFTEYRNRKLSKTRLRLAQKQFDLAMEGNTTMLVWLGKNLLGQTDIPLELETKEDNKLQLTYSLDQNEKI